MTIVDFCCSSTNCILRNSGRQAGGEAKKRTEKVRRNNIVWNPLEHLGHSTIKVRKRPNSSHFALFALPAGGGAGFTLMFSQWPYNQPNPYLKGSLRNNSKIKNVCSDTTKCVHWQLYKNKSRVGCMKSQK